MYIIMTPFLFFFALLRIWFIVSAISILFKFWIKHTIDRPAQIASRDAARYELRSRKEDQNTRT